MAENSVSQDAFAAVKSLGSKEFGDTRAPCCGFLAKKPPAFKQTLVLLRHSIRRDREDPTWRGSPDGRDWPSDTPITKPGFDLSRNVALEILELHKEARFNAVACSPYRRCLETASEVAKLLDLPVVLDQEMGEIWDNDIHQEPQPWRSNAQLRPMCKDLGLTIVNPVIDGGYKLFGKRPLYPETLESAKTRYIVRIETYIEQSTATQQNFIIVTHADALAAALQLFERGNANVQSMEYCARIVAQRSKRPSVSMETKEAGVFAKMWDVQFKGVEVEKFVVEKHMAKYYEKEHQEKCEEVTAHVVQRKKNRTRTDAMFMKTIHRVAKAGTEDHDDEDLVGQNGATTSSRV